MKPGRFALVFIIIAIDNIDVIDSDKNASKHIPSNDVWQNWLPLKEKKRGSDVAVNAKILFKREARFGLRVEREADDYYDKGGESDSEDYYERKEWSDVFRQAHPHAKPPPVKLDHPDLVDIEGIHVKPHHGNGKGHKPDNGKKEKVKKIKKEENAEKTKENQQARQNKENRDRVRKKAASKAKREDNSRDRASAVDALKLF